MGNAPKSWRTVEIEQQVEYGFTMDYVKVKIADWSVVKDYAYILHDKDSEIDENGVQNPKAPHIHCMVRFNSSVPTTAILKRLEGVVPVNHLEKCKSWGGAMAYLTHANAPDKYQYSDDEVISNFDWKSEVVLKKQKFDLDPVLDMIGKGLIPYSKITDYVPADVYARNRSLIKNAYEWHELHNEGVDRTMECIFISGEARSGKTSFAKSIPESRHLSYYISSGGENPLDDYRGQECIILDDIRPRTFAMSDLLKLTDPYTDSKVGCRYYNKSISNCKLLIATSVIDLKDFYLSVQEHESEPIKQLYGRFLTRYKFENGQLYLFIYNARTENYMSMGSIPNPLKVKEDKAVRDKLISSAKQALLSFGCDETSVKYMFGENVDLPNDIDDILLK